jgi:hypothetical protein
MGEIAIMISSDTKKDAHIMVEIHYNTSCHEYTPRGRGLVRVAGQSCLASPSALCDALSFAKKLANYIGAIKPFIYHDNLTRAAA